MDLEIIKQVITDNPGVVEFGSFGSGVSNIWIKKAENRLGIKLPFSYKWWLENYGGGEINGEEIYSIYEMDFDEVVGGDVVYINELKRKNGVTTDLQLTIHENDQGERYFLDLKKVDEYGESPVCVDYEENIYADNFLDFIKRKIYE